MLFHYINHYINIQINNVYLLYIRFLVVFFITTELNNQLCEVK